MKTKQLIRTLTAFFAMIALVLVLVNCKKKEEVTPPEPETTGLSAFYKFSDNVNDESGNENNGTNHGATYVDDRFGISKSALQFNGSGNYVQVPSSNSLTITNNISVCFWMKKGGYNGFRVPISKRNSSDAEQHFNVVLEASNGVSFQYSGLGAPAPHYEGFLPLNSAYSVLSDGNWHFVVFLHTFGSRANDALFIDNVSYNVTYPNWFTNFTYPAVPDNSPLQFGRQMSQDYYDGLLDDIRIFNKLLAASEINTLYHEGGW